MRSRASPTRPGPSRRLTSSFGNPREFAPGTKMAYGGMRRDEQRLQLLAYLRTLSADPQPLP
jgi:cytochrome c